MAIPDNHYDTGAYKVALFTAGGSYIEDVNLHALPARDDVITLYDGYGRKEGSYRVLWREFDFYEAGQSGHRAIVVPQNLNVK